MNRSMSAGPSGDCVPLRRIKTEPPDGEIIQVTVPGKWERRFLASFDSGRRSLLKIQTLHPDTRFSWADVFRLNCKNGPSHGFHPLLSLNRPLCPSFFLIFFISISKSGISFLFRGDLKRLKLNEILAGTLLILFNAFWSFRWGLLFQRAAHQ